MGKGETLDFEEERRETRDADQTLATTVGPERPLRVMTFNIWLGGASVENGLEKIAKHILEMEPDIVALQEVSSAEVAEKLIYILGPTKWQCRYHPSELYPDTAILTKHLFVEDQQSMHLQFKRNITDFYRHEEAYASRAVVTYGMGATIRLREPPKLLVNFVSLHLEYRSYGPYAANNKEVTESAQIMTGERNKHGYGRAQNIEQLLNNEIFKQYLHMAETQPLIVAGDFNAPSHLDWIEETKNIHGGWKFEWPSSKLLMDAGLNDSFRALHPDPVKEPGITWSTVQKNVGPEWDWSIPEPQDRIDFIFYKPNDHFYPTRSANYAGTEPLKPIPNHYQNDWPSDHYSVISDFVLNFPLEEEEELQRQETNENITNGSNSFESAGYNVSQMFK